MKPIFFFLSVSIFSYAGHLSLDDAITKTLASHPDAKRFALQVQSAHYGTDALRADRLPQLTLLGEYDPIKTYVMNQNGAFATKESDGWSANAVLTQKVWDFSKTSYAIKSQEIQEEISSLSLDDAKAFLAYQVKLAYDLAIVQQEAIRIREHDLKSKEELYAQAKMLVEQGMKTDADASRFLSALYAAKDDVSRARADLDKSILALSLYINEPLDTDTILDGNIEQIPRAEENVERLIETSPSLAALKKGVVKNDFIFQSIQASHYGSLDAIASYARQNALNTYDTRLVGISLKIPLYTGGRISAQSEQALIGREIAQEEVNAKTLLFQKEANTLLIDLKRQNETLEAKEMQLRSSERTFTLIEGRYKEGLSTYLDVLDATGQRLDARLGLLLTHYEQRSTVYRLQYLEGKIK